MSVNINDLPFDAVLYLVGEIDDTTDNPAVTLRWEENNQGPYINDGTTETLATEIICTASAQQAGSGGAEVFYLTGGTLVSGETRQVQYTATKRGIPNGETNNPPITNDTDRYREHKNNSVWLLSEVISIKSLQEVFNTSVAETLDRYAEFQSYGGTQDVLVAIGRNYFKIPEGYDNSDITSVSASVITAGTGGTTDVQLVTGGNNILSTAISILAGQTGSETNPTQPVINPSYDTVSTNQIIRVDVTAQNSTTPAKGLLVVIKFTKNT